MKPKGIESFGGEFTGEVFDEDEGEVEDGGGWRKMWRS